MISQAYGEAIAPLVDLVRTVKEQGQYPFGPAFVPGSGGWSLLGERSVLVLGTSNYLGLAEHPVVLEATKRALDRYGASACGSRLANGTTPVHEELEERLAEWLGAEAVLTFSSGYLANLGAISALCDADTVVVNDQLNHASIMDAARLSGGQVKIFAHNSMAKLEYILARNATAPKRFIAVDGVYSMDGDVAPLREIEKLAAEHEAFLMVDEAHAIGVLGPHGRGATEHFGVRPDLVTGTFSKSLGAVGGFVAGSGDVIEFMRHAARPHTFNASPPAATVAGVLAALDLMRAQPWRIEKLWENTERFRAGLIARGFDPMRSSTPIVPVFIGDEALALGIASDLLRRGVYVFTAMHPAVPLGGSRFRTTVTAAMEPPDIDHALDTLYEVARARGLFG